jgi:hypothetical protein
MVPGSFRRVHSGKACKTPGIGVWPPSRARPLCLRAYGAAKRPETTGLALGARAVARPLRGGVPPSMLTETTPTGGSGEVEGWLWQRGARVFPMAPMTAGGRAPRRSEGDPWQPDSSSGTSEPAEGSQGPLSPTPTDRSPDGPAPSGLTASRSRCRRCRSLAAASDCERAFTGRGGPR